MFILFLPFDDGDDDDGDEDDDDVEEEGEEEVEVEETSEILFLSFPVFFSVFFTSAYHYSAPLISPL